jgi:hypothetical protein
MSYIFNADMYCDDCGEDIRRAIDAAGNTPADPDDEGSYDSGEYPKRCNGSSDEFDCPEHCGSGKDCSNVYEFPDGWKIGAWLENDLTTAGEDYVKDAVRWGGEVAELWAEYYDYLDFEDSDEDDDSED